MLVSKKSGVNYTYKINDTKYEIHEYNGNKGWCLNEYKKGSKNSNFCNEWLLCDSYGYNGLTLKSCKEMILMNWNNNNIN